jgi:hypothetical protein
MSTRRAVPVFLAVVFGFIVLGLGNYLAARQAATSEESIAALRAEIEFLRNREMQTATGTAGRHPSAVTSMMDDESRASIVADVKRELSVEMGLLPLTLLRDRRNSFVELNSYDDRGASNYGTAGYLGKGYFITVKHAVVALKDEDNRQGQRKITSVKIVYGGKEIPARVIDTGDADVEVHSGDWAIIKTAKELDLPSLHVDTAFGYDFAEPIFRLGNDYSKGIILSTGYVGQRTSNNLITCLTDGHPGVSGGGVLNGDGHLVGIPIGRMQGDYRFSFILPLRAEMFKKIPQTIQLGE